MKIRSFLLGVVSFLLLGVVALFQPGGAQFPALYAHEAGLPTSITVPVNGGWDARAKCDESSATGPWTFTVVGLTGKISKVNVQLYRYALPTASFDEPTVYRVCASNTGTGTAPDGRPQLFCPSVPVGAVESAGSVTINKPSLGISGSLTLSQGAYCVRPTATGNGTITIQISHL